mgnify:CR=1 FL=1
MNVLEFIAFLIVFGGLIFACCYCYRYETKRQKRWEERQDRFVASLEDIAFVLNNRLHM